MLSGAFPILEFIYHNSTRSNLVLTSHFQEDKKAYIIGSEFQVSMGWQLRCYSISKDVVKHTHSHQTQAERLKRDVNPRKDPGGCSLSFPLDSSARHPASSNLGRGLFILLGSSQGYRSLMVLASLKVFHIWARSMLYVSPKETLLPSALLRQILEKHSDSLTQGRC